MDINTMKQFVTVMENGSLLAAAEKLFLSRAAISKSMSRLERELGITLFCRTAKGMLPTEAANTLLQGVKEVLRAYANLEKLCAGMASNRSVVKLGLTYGLNLVFADKIHSFQEKHPEIQLDVVTCTFDDFPKLLLENKLSLGCSGVKYHQLDKLKSSLVLRSELYWGVSSKSPIAARGYITDEEIMSMPICVPQGGKQIRSDAESIIWIDDNGDVHDTPPSNHYIFDDNMFFLLKVAEEGKGIISIAKDGIPKSVSGVTFVPGKGKKYYWQVYMYLPDVKTPEPVKAVILDFFKSDSLID